MSDNYDPTLTDGKKIANFNNFMEYGRVGQKKFAGVFFEEFEKKLAGLKGVEVYKEMADNDDVVGAILFAIEMLIKQVSFTVEVAGDGKDDRRASDFIEECLKDLDPGWNATLSEILSFLTFGWSVHEICYKRRSGANKKKALNSKYSDGLIGWQKFSVRSQDTLYRWEYNADDELVGFSQMAPPDYTIRTIPMEKLLHFKTRSRKENPEGRSVLRNAYKDYYFKNRMQVIEGIGVERDLAGLPVLKPGNTDIFDKTDPDAVAALSYAKKLVTSLRRDSIEGVVLPPDWELSLLNGGSRRQFEVGSVIERYDKRIAMTVMADFIFLGHQETGSFALSSSKTKMFSMAIGSYLDIITEVMNNQAIPRLINLNGDHFKNISDYPKLKHGDIEKRDLNELSSYIANMVKIGAISPDTELEKYLRDEADLPEQIEDAALSEMPQDKKPQDNNVDTQGNQDKLEEGDSGDPAKK